MPDLNNPLTPGEVPPQFMEAAFMTGHVPHRVLGSDPRISYALYIPPKLYGAERGKLPLLVYVHGMRRDLSPMHGCLDKFADSVGCAVLAPLFPAGLDSPDDLHSYKFLRSATVRSDLALLSMLDEIARRWPGVETAKIFLTGFSSGGQFAHRFLYLYPERLAAISVGAPGEVTPLDYELPWPGGVADVTTRFGRSVNVELITRLPIQLVVGSKDNTPHGGHEYRAWLQQRKAAQHGSSGSSSGPSKKTGGGGSKKRGRLDELEHLGEMWAQVGIKTRFDVVEGVGHSFPGVSDCVLRFMRPLIENAG